MNYEDEAYGGEMMEHPYSKTLHFNKRKNIEYYDEPFSAEKDEDTHVPLWIPVTMFTIFALMFILQI